MPRTHQKGSHCAGALHCAFKNFVVMSSLCELERPLNPIMFSQESSRKDGISARKVSMVL
jgi:hypothetical protein